MGIGGSWVSPGAANRTPLHETRNPAWRRQFVGKRQGDAVKLDQDVRNITGAPLSCRHITEGVKRLLAFHQVVLR
jgi:hypothetical protein